MADAFNIETAAQDFAGEGRTIGITNEDTGNRDYSYSRRQMKLKVNGWTFSAIWGTGAYCTGARQDGFITGDTPPSSPDAEIAVWRDGGSMIDLHGDTVEGWVLPSSFVAAVEATERDDEEGIRAALVRWDDDDTPDPDTKEGGTTDG